MDSNKNSIISISFWQKVFVNTSNIGGNPEDNEETRLHKLIMVLIAIMISVAASIWGLIYISFGELRSGLIPLTYTLITIVSLLIMRAFNIYRIFSFVQIFLILILPFLLMVSLGGFINGSGVIIWGFFAPISALLSGKVREAIYWFLGFVLLVLLSGFIQPLFDFDNNLPDLVKIIFFVINISTVSLIVFLVLKSFVTRKDDMIGLMRKNRELEQSYLQQEVTLRQSEKLATLGRLSAGMAHELNNPAAVAMSGSKQLKELFDTIEELLFEFGRMNLSEKQIEVINNFNDRIYTNDKKQIELDPLTRSDREHEIESWLDTQKISDSRNLASTFACLDFKVSDLATFTQYFSRVEMQTILSATRNIFEAHKLLEEVGSGSGKITEIVKSLKSYTYLDKAPSQSINIHEGLNDTLVMLRSQLKKGIIIQKEYDESLPRIEAFGSELNQVWTNIIDNAISAMKGKGTLKLNTSNRKPWLVVQIMNNGPAIPQDIQRKVFDPFFTTKPPGEGTGLGLNISHNIIVQKHQGEISLKSEDDETCFEVRLPMNS